MMRATKLTSILLLAIGLTGCATKQPEKYTWGNYNLSLYSYYKDSNTTAKHLAELEAIVAKAERSNEKVAPGLHAELGYFLLQTGRPVDGRSEFEKEKATWPESTHLMNTMIGIADKAMVNTSLKESQ